MGSGCLPGRVLCLRRCGKSLKTQLATFAGEITTCKCLTGQDILERQLNIARIKRGSLNEAQIVLARECLCLFRRNSPEMLQIALVSHEHNNNVTVGVIPEFLEPSLHILIRLTLADIINK